MGQSLVSLDTDRIKEYIFATAKLREISGASAILRDLNERTMPALAETYQAQTIYVGGGSGLFVVPSDRAHDLITAVQRAQPSPASLCPSPITLILTRTLLKISGAVSAISLQPQSCAPPAPVPS